MSLTIKDMVRDAHQTALEKGFYDNIPDATDINSLGAQIALMHSELSEALEALRDEQLEMFVSFNGQKPEGMVVELADCIIRIADTCGALGLDLEQAIVEKMAYNQTRSHKHGRQNL